MSKGITYGVDGWFWECASGKLGVIYGKLEKLAYLPPAEKEEVARFLQVAPLFQKSLREYHDQRWSNNPKNSPLSLRKYRGYLVQKYAP